MWKEITELKNTVQMQQEVISKYQQTTADFTSTSNKTIAEMNKLAYQLKNQVDSFKTSPSNLKREVKKDTEERILQFETDISYEKDEGQSFSH